MINIKNSNIKIGITSRFRRKEPAPLGRRTIRSIPALQHGYLQRICILDDVLLLCILHLEISLEIVVSNNVDNK